MAAEAGSRYDAMDRYECRNAVIRDLEYSGLLERQEKYAHTISQCYRCKTVIEPLPALQWYVRVQPLADEAIKAVREGRTKNHTEILGKHLFCVDGRH
jgi:valyl-tRNA synthetase